MPENVKAKQMANPVETAGDKMNGLRLSPTAPMSVTHFRFGRSA